MKSNPKKATRINKSERIEFRCTKAFKDILKEVADSEDLSLSNLLEEICTDKIKGYLTDKQPQPREIKSRIQPSQIEPMKDTQSEVKPQTKPPTKRSDYEREIWRMLSEGATPTQTATWLNENGYKPQRGDEFTMNSVHSIRRRLKRENEQQKELEIMTEQEL